MRRAGQGKSQDPASSMNLSSLARLVSGFVTFSGGCGASSGDQRVQACAAVLSQASIVLLVFTVQPSASLSAWVGILLQGWVRACMKTWLAVEGDTTVKGKPGVADPDLLLRSSPLPAFQSQPLGFYQSSLPMWISAEEWVSSECLAWFKNSLFTTEKCTL